MTELYDKFLLCLEHEFLCEICCPNCGMNNTFSKDLLNVTNYQECKYCCSYRFSVKTCDVENCTRRFFSVNGMLQCCEHSVVVLEYRAVILFFLEMTNYFECKSHPLYIEGLQSNNDVKLNTKTNNISNITINTSNTSNAISNNETSNTPDKNKTCTGIVARTGNICGRPSKCEFNGEPRCKFHGK